MKSWGKEGPSRQTDVVAGEITWGEAYERRMRRFNLKVVLLALVALVALIGCSLLGW
jgi:hypothetical protein